MPPHHIDRIDRFYTNIHAKFTVEILTEHNVSDHFPIMLTIDPVDN